MLTTNNGFMHIAVRCRPLSSTELLKTGHYTTIEIEDFKKCTIQSPADAQGESNQKTFNFNTILDATSSQEQVYQEIAFPIVGAVLTGCNGAIYVYGQTGAGKTYTIEGIAASHEQKGVILRAFEHIFNHIKDTPEKFFTVQVSYFRLFNEKLIDLLAEGKELKMRNRRGIGLVIEGMTSVRVQSVEDIYKQFEFGKKNKTLAASYSDPGFSKSHSIFSITIETCEVGLDGKEEIRSGKLDLVDLAGSENSVKPPHGLRWSTFMHRSIYYFPIILRQLADEKTKFVPYRESRLTWLLQNSLGGTTLTALIGNISSAVRDFDETLRTLQFCQQAKKVKTNAIINKKSLEEESCLGNFIRELNELKTELQNLYSEQNSNKLEYNLFIKPNQIDQEEDDDPKNEIEEQTNC